MLNIVYIVSRYKVTFACYFRGHSVFEHPHKKIVFSYIKNQCRYSKYYPTIKSISSFRVQIFGVSSLSMVFMSYRLMKHFAFHLSGVCMV